MRILRNLSTPPSKFVVNASLQRGKQETTFSQNLEAREDVIRTMSSTVTNCPRRCRSRQLLQYMDKSENR